MGITGLIPFLEKASSSVNIRKLQGSSAAVDSYCWLHKGVFACAEKLIMGETTDIHIQYCLKYVDMLMRHKIKVIMVFDGRHLPAKAETERRRRKARNESKQLAKEYLRRNEIDKARSHMRRAVDVTHEMALELIKECRSRGVDCIVAPYEADAQMAWLNKIGIADYIITEDSDLTLFGAKNILFKLDLTGNALLVEDTKLYLAMGCKPEKYTFDKFRRMCILSGCDYLDSLQGIGLKKACKFILTTEEDDVKKALKKIPSYLKMKQLVVPDEYIESFLKAEATFKHMFIYNPLERRMERLNELEELQTDESHCSNAGSFLDDEEQAFQLALGNLNPFTLKQLDDWHPDRKWSEVKSKHKSIWHSRNVSELSNEPCGDKKHDIQTVVPMFQFKKIEFKQMAEMEIQEKISEERCKLEEAEIFSMYKYASPKMERKRKRRPSTSSSSETEESEKSPAAERTPKKYSHNPFAKVNSSLDNIQKSPVCTNNSLLKLLSPKKSNDNNFNIQKVSVKSRFFVENIKQVLKKPFAARDLTSEMLKIEKKTNKYIEQQQDLYHCSLQSPKNKIEENDTTTFDAQAFYSTSQNSEEENNKDSKESSEAPTPYSESCISSQKNQPSVSTVSNEEGAIILLSDIEEEEISKKPLQSTTSGVSKLTTTLSQRSQVSLPKTKSKTQIKHSKSAKNLGIVDPKQSKLSMFGFQKRPSLKKL